MGTERTYVFGGDGGSGGSQLEVTARLPGMLGGNRGVEPAGLGRDDG